MCLICMCIVVTLVLITQRTRDFAQLLYCICDQIKSTNGLLLVVNSINLSTRKVGIGSDVRSFVEVHGQSYSPLIAFGHERYLEQLSIL